jgi:hypothetical protein
MHFPLQKAWLGAALGLSLMLPAAQSLALNIVTEDVTPLVSVNPGVYGIEIRGGRPGAADWELGVGTQTSNAGTFSQGNINWGNDPLNFEFVWGPNEVSAMIGGLTRTWQANWEIGNAIRIGISGRDGFADLVINSLDGVVDAPLFTFNRTNEGFTNYFIAGNSLSDGWTMTGTINMTNGGGSRRLVHITTAEYTPTTDVPVPATVGLFGLGLAGLIIGRRRKR